MEQFTNPSLTTEQIEKLKNQFIKEFETIIQKSTPEVKELWKQNGQIIITNNFIIIPSALHKRLERRLKDSFVILLNKYGLVLA
jgi:hypothetical protein